MHASTNAPFTRRYLHIGLTAPASLFAPARIRAAWALARLRHPPLAATLRMEPGVYDSARFVYAAPRSVADALARADAALEYTEESKDELLDRYLNGPRTLGPERLAYLFVASEPAQGKAPASELPTPAMTPRADAESFQLHSQPEAEAAEDDIRNFDVVLCTTHFLGDGMALNRCMNEFFELIGAPERTTDAFEATLAEEWDAQWGSSARAKGQAGSREVYPRTVEDCLPVLPCGMMRAAAIKVDFENTQKKAIVCFTFFLVFWMWANMSATTVGLPRIPARKGQAEAHGCADACTGRGAHEDDSEDVQGAWSVDCECDVCAKCAFVESHAGGRAGCGREADVCATWS